MGEVPLCTFDGGYTFISRFSGLVRGPTNFEIREWYTFQRKRGGGWYQSGRGCQQKGTGPPRHNLFVLTVTTVSGRARLGREQKSCMLTQEIQFIPHEA